MSPFDLFGIPGMKGSVFGPNPTPIIPQIPQIGALPVGPTTVGMPVATVDLLSDPTPVLAMNPYELGNDFADGSAPGGFGGGFTGTGYAQEAGDAPAQTPTDWAGKFKSLGGLLSEPGPQRSAPAIAPPQAGGGGRGFDVTPFLRQGILRRAK